IATCKSGTFGPYFKIPLDELTRTLGQASPKPARISAAWAPWEPYPGASMGAFALTKSIFNALAAAVTVAPTTRPIDPSRCAFWLSLPAASTIRLATESPDEARCRTEAPSGFEVTANTNTPRLCANAKSMLGRSDSYPKYAANVTASAARGDSLVSQAAAEPAIVEPISPRFASAMVRIPASRASCSVDSRTAEPAEPTRS